MSQQTGTWTECLFSEPADFTALASFTSEASLLGGQNLQPTLFPSFFEGVRAKGRAFSLLARGVLSVTGTPTYTFTVRIGSTLAVVTGAILGVSAAITTISGVTNAWWELRYDGVLRTPGQGGNNATVSGTGYVMSPGGFANISGGNAPTYPLVPSQGALGTWTQTIDNSVQNYLQVSVACSASSASNTITCKQLIVNGLN